MLTPVCLSGIYFVSRVTLFISKESVIKWAVRDIYGSIVLEDQRSVVRLNIGMHEFLFLSRSRWIPVRTSMYFAGILLSVKVLLSGTLYRLSKTLSILMNFSLSTVQRGLPSAVMYSMMAFVLSWYSLDLGSYGVAAAIDIVIVGWDADLDLFTDFWDGFLYLQYSAKWPCSRCDQSALVFPRIITLVNLQNLHFAVFSDTEKPLPLSYFISVCLVKASQTSEPLFFFDDTESSVSLSEKKAQIYIGGCNWLFGNSNIWILASNNRAFNNIPIMQCLTWAPRITQSKFYRGQPSLTKFT